MCELIDDARIESDGGAAGIESSVIGGYLGKTSPDIEEGQRFVGQFHNLHTFQTFSEKESGHGRILHGTLEENAAELIRLNMAGHGIFLMINEGDGQGRKAKNVIRVRYAFGDFDSPGGLEKLKAANLKPHIIVESSPGKYHGYWKVADDMPLDQFTPFQKALAKKFGSDSAVTDLPRVMRVPGFLHQKGEPFMTRIVEVVA